MKIFISFSILFKKTATAVALCTEGKGLVRVNGRPLHLVEPQCLRYKVSISYVKHKKNHFLLCNKHFLFFKLEEPILLLGRDKFSAVDIRIRVKGGGHISQVYGKCKSFLISSWIA